ncbi:MAG TPA: type II toxin-antitoxin system HicB family antitoxin [Thermomicrobiales bacterium]|nr:type II toxin-antitoxin system HicB family antitoxin [Thermomicrobiales bacterium]
MSRLTYSVLLQPAPDEGGFTVTVPELPGIVTQGESFEEALAMARDAIALHVEGLAADGLEVPIERVAPIIAQVQVEIRHLVVA